mmetsp:Transcript_74113/g.191167  ORF Transcript_74113/g.191167 Transcript_74113/m.191167 type:complete len:480 (-) Transcript_74113:193-1632(-)
MQALEVSKDVANTRQEPEQKRTAVKRDLWAMGVGAVISGHFFGWQVTLSDGFGSGLVALFFSTILYMVLSSSVAEVVSIQGTGAGPCQFAKACFGRHLAFVTGLAECLKCVVVVGVISTGIGAYLGEIMQTSEELAPLWWLGFLAVFTALNIVGGEMSKNSQLAITAGAVVMLIVFFVGAIFTGVDFNTHALGGKGLWDSTSMSGIWAAWPFALWFYLGIEELPLAMEITVNPAKAMPRGLSISFATLVFLAVSTFFISCSIPPGAAGMATTTYPLLLGYQYIFGNSETTRWSCLLLVTGLVASLHSFIFATGQLIAQMAYDGYFPKGLNRRTQSTGRPYVAIITGSALTYLITVVLYLATGKDGNLIGAITIAMCLFCTMISYVVQLACFLWCRIKLPEAERHFRSPFGVAGAVAGLVLCAISFGAILYLPTTEASYLYGLAMATVILIVCTVAREVSWSKSEQAAKASLSDASANSA